VTLVGERQRGGPVGQETAPQDDAARWAGLASRVGQGDRAAEAELADLFHQRVRLFASARLHGSDAASDMFRKHARTLRPDWSASRERDEVRAVHARVSEALRAVSPVRSR
jgi:hypothetical protein